MNKEAEQNFYSKTIKSTKVSFDNNKTILESDRNAVEAKELKTTLLEVYLPELYALF